MSVDPTTMTQDEVDACWIALNGMDAIGTTKGVTILGIDLGSTFGWSFIDKYKILDVGWYRTTRPGESEGMSGLRFKRALHDIVGGFKPTAVWFEDPKGRFRGQGGKYIMRQIGILEAELTELEIPFGTVHQSTLKLFATGKGNASKEAMREALVSRLNG